MSSTCGYCGAVNKGAYKGRCPSCPDKIYIEQSCSTCEHGPGSSCDNSECCEHPRCFIPNLWTPK